MTAHCQGLSSASLPCPPGSTPAGCPLMVPACMTSQACLLQNSGSSQRTATLLHVPVCGIWLKDPQRLCDFNGTDGLQGQEDLVIPSLVTLAPSKTRGQQAHSTYMSTAGQPNAGVTRDIRTHANYQLLELEPGKILGDSGPYKW